MNLPKVFLKLCVVNIVLLVAYSIASFFEWNRLLELPLVASVLWRPYIIQIWFSGTVPIIVDGLFWEINSSYAIMLVTIILNLGVIWRILHRNP